MKTLTFNKEARCAALAFKEREAKRRAQAELELAQRINRAICARIDMIIIAEESLPEIPGYPKEWWGYGRERTWAKRNSKRNRKDRQQARNKKACSLWLY